MATGQLFTKRYTGSLRHKQLLSSQSGRHERFRQVEMHQPTAILISSNPGVLASLQEQLTQANFAVFAAASALDGYDYAVHTLGITLPARTTVLLIDTSDVHSLLVAAGLAQRMQQRVIPPVWLIALLDAKDPERELEARLAGCQQVLPLPLVEDALA